MERGIYFDGWFPHEHCYHPSMPPRRLRMIDDLADMHGTMLVWAGLGGGTISLPYLEEEAFGVVPARYRQHGFVNDSEFIAAAKARGIDLFSIVFEAQAWEFPAEIVDGEVVAQNQLRGATPPTTVGLREFSTDTGPESWKPFRHYFPDGLINSRGEQVNDLWEEVACRDLDGKPLHAHWVEVDENGQQCYLANRNNPVWREYLKAIIKIQIDAGSPGIQLDESDVPIMALRYGGTFDADTMMGFRSYLQSLDAVPDEIAGVELATFDYGDWLTASGYRPGIAPQALPLYDHYVRFLVLESDRTFKEITGYIRDYARQTGRSVRVAGNFYDCAPMYDGMVDDVDVLVTEMRITRYQQPWYFRHGVGMARGRPLVAVENPYGGITEALSARLKNGHGHDQFRMTIYEASAMGANMSLPYGSWLGTEIRDSYWAPRDLCVEIGEFVAAMDPLTSNRSSHRTAVIYPVASMMRESLDSDLFSDAGRWYDRVETDMPPTSYWKSIEALSRSSKVYDVIPLPDEQLRRTDTGLDQLTDYRVIIVPDAWATSSAQHDLLIAFADHGGRVVIHGAYGADLPDPQRLLDHPNTIVVDSVEQLPALAADDLIADLGPLAAANLHRLSDTKSAVHLINYDYDPEADELHTRSDLAVDVHLTHRITTAILHRPGRADEELKVDVAQHRARFTVPELDVYAVVELV